MVSKFHATLHVGKSLDGSPMLEVTDRGSTNGTFVDGSKIFQRTALRHGSRIMFGNFPKQGNQIVFMVELPGRGGGGGAGGSDGAEGAAKRGASPIGGSLEEPRDDMVRRLPQLARLRLASRGASRTDKILRNLWPDSIQWSIGRAQSREAQSRESFELPRIL